MPDKLGQKRRAKAISRLHSGSDVHLRTTRPASYNPRTGKRYRDCRIDNQPPGSPAVVTLGWWKWVGPPLSR